MKIIWQPNPLYSTVELDDHDREVLRLKITIEEMNERLCDAHFNLQEGERFNPDRARHAVQLEKWIGKDSDMEKRIDMLFAYYVEQLEGGTHVGDCSCVPCTCDKCLAEDMLGVNTIKGCGKHQLYKIDGAFGAKNDGSVSLEEAIAKLDAYVPKAEWDGWEAHAPRWKAEADRAAIWLRAYRDQHFAGAAA